jgi:hypothetical protein
MAEEPENGEETPDKEGRRVTVADFEMDCPHCGKKVSVTVFRRTIKAMVKAITELIPVVKPGGQGDLGLGVEAPGDKVEAK